MEAAIKSEQETTMNPLILCTAVALNIFSAPAGNTVVGEVPAYQRVYLMDGSLMRDWVFIGKPSDGGVSPRGWVIYSGLGYCPREKSGDSRTAFDYGLGHASRRLWAARPHTQRLSWQPSH
jgi:hypothetical protein